MHKVLIEHELYKDVARELRVGIMTVSRLVKKVKNNPRFLEVTGLIRDCKLANRIKMVTVIK